MWRVVRKQPVLASVTLKITVSQCLVTEEERGRVRAIFTSEASSEGGGLGASYLRH